jgi:hypothetical protein
MPKTRRTAHDIYPKLRTFADAAHYYRSITPLRGHRNSPARPLAKGKRTTSLWCITPIPNGIACMNGSHAVITYYQDGWVRITPTATPVQDLAIIRAVAPVATARWDYYKNRLVVRFDGAPYTCDVSDPAGVWLPPTTTFAPLPAIAGS